MSCAKNDDKYISKEVFDRHINAEIIYQQNYVDIGTAPKKMFTLGIIHGLKFAQVVVENNCCVINTGEKNE